MVHKTWEMTLNSSEPRLACRQTLSHQEVQFLLPNHRVTPYKVKMVDLSSKEFRIIINNSKVCSRAVTCKKGREVVSPSRFIITTTHFISPRAQYKDFKTLTAASSCMTHRVT